MIDTRKQFQLQTGVFLKRPDVVTFDASKNLLKSSSNRKSYYLETWHAASGNQALQVYIHDDPGLTLTYFTARSNWVTYSFEWG